MRGSAGGGEIRRLFAFLPILLWLAYILLSEPLGYALFLLATVALHETGHLFAFLVLGEPLPLFRGKKLGLLLTPQSKILSYPKEIFICASGPFFNLLAAASLLPALHTGYSTEAHFCFFSFNLMTALLNLLPIDGFDGGRILSALLSLTLGPNISRRLSDAVSLFFVLLFYFTGVYLFFLAGASVQMLFFSFLLLAGEVKRRPTLFKDL